MKVEFDRKVDAAYIYFKDKIKKGDVKKTISLDGNINVDLNKQNKIIGIEILHASESMTLKPSSICGKPIKTAILD